MQWESVPYPLDATRARLQRGLVGVDGGTRFKPSRLYSFCSSWVRSWRSRFCRLYRMWVTRTRPVRSITTRLGNPLKPNALHRSLFGIKRHRQCNVATLHNRSHPLGCIAAFVCADEHGFNVSLILVHWRECAPVPATLRYMENTRWQRNRGPEFCPTSRWSAPNPG